MGVTIRKTRRWPAWVLRWSTPIMPVPAFWYFKTRRAAMSARASLRYSANATIDRVLCLRQPVWMDGAR